MFEIRAIIASWLVGSMPGGGGKIEWPSHWTAATVMPITRMPASTARMLRNMSALLSPRWFAASDSRCQKASACWIWRRQHRAAEGLFLLSEAFYFAERDPRPRGTAGTLRAVFGMGVL